MGGAAGGGSGEAWDDFPFSVGSWDDFGIAEQKQLVQSSRRGDIFVPSSPKISSPAPTLFVNFFTLLTFDWNSAGIRFQNGSPFNIARRSENSQPPALESEPL